MRKRELARSVLVAVITLVTFAGGSTVSSAGELTMAETEKDAIVGEYVRRAFNDEAFVVLGFVTANDSAGKRWMLLEIAATSQPGRFITLEREDFTLVTPDEQKIPMASQPVFQEAFGETLQLNSKANVQSQPLNYLPRRANHLCRLGFFADMNKRGRRIAFDEAYLNPTTACVGRVYFEIPDGIQHGQHVLLVELSESTLEVPFTIMTDDEEKQFNKEWKQIAKAARKSKESA